MSLFAVFHGLLYAFWVLATGAVVVTLTSLPIPHSFKLAVRLSAARGKLCDGDFRALPAWLTELVVPQAWFLHFYVIGAACNAVVLLIHGSWCCHITGSGSAGFADEDGGVAQWRSLLVLALFQVHLLRRVLETLLIFKYPDTARMHLFAYLFGLSYYMVVPLSLLPDTLFHQLEAAQQLQFPAITVDTPSIVAQLQRAAQLTMAAQPITLLLGVAVFTLGNILQLWSHCQLAALQRRCSSQVAAEPHRAAVLSAGMQGSSPSAAKYSLPTGGMFELVSCPHYFAEILVYTGVVVVMFAAPLPLLIWLWVVCNLVLAASATHAWYRKQFKEYPLHRRALIPFLW